LLLASSLCVSSAVVWGFHESGHLPVDEPWFVILSLLPHAAALLMFAWVRSQGVILWLVAPWILHDGAYLALLPSGSLSWDVAIYWRATHGLMLIFSGAPSLLVLAWSAVRGRLDS
jgi:hypothetical protein